MKSEDLVKYLCVLANSESVRCVSYDTVFDLFSKDREYMSSLENKSSDILKDTNINLLHPTYEIHNILLSHSDDISISYYTNIVKIVQMLSKKIIYFMQFFQKHILSCILYI